MDRYRDSDSTYQYHLALNAENKDAFIAFMALRNGKTNISYVGATFQTADANYRSDGSIMFSDESAAYGRMVSNSLKTGKEEMGVITDGGVLVLPNYLNEKTESKYVEYGYDFKGGNLVDPVSGKTLNTITTAHTHPTGGDMSGDVGFARNKTPQKPMYSIHLGGETKGNIEYLLHSGKPGSYAFRTTRHHPSLTVSGIVSGDISLRAFSKSIINKHMRTGKFNPWP
jgi:hypothetical protein